MRQGGIILAADRVCSKKRAKNENTKKIAHSKHTTKSTEMPAIATNSRQCATKHVPRISPNSPASIDPGFCGNRPRTTVGERPVQRNSATTRIIRRETTVPISVARRVYLYGQRVGLYKLLRSHLIGAGSITGMGKASNAVAEPPGVYSTPPGEKERQSQVICDTCPTNSTPRGRGCARRVRCCVWCSVDRPPWLFPTIASTRPTHREIQSTLRTTRNF